MTTIGILAIQGNVIEHERVLDSLDAPHVRVRNADELSECTHLIIPGGESTTMLHFLRVLQPELGAKIVRRSEEGTLPILGTCAGAIVLSSDIEGEFAYEPLALMDVTISRNAYGRQIASFHAAVPFQGAQLQCSFIRAPKITRVGERVTVLSEHDGKPVIVQSGDTVLCTCHPEMRGDTRLHEWFIQSYN